MLSANIIRNLQHSPMTSPGPENPPPAELTKAPWRVLLVDSEASSRASTQVLLEAQGLAVVAVDSGEAAVTRSARQSFDLILTDLQLPGIDGLEAARRIRARERLQGMVRIAIVAHVRDASNIDRAELTAAGLDEVALKPLTQEALQRLIDCGLLKTAPSAASGRRGLSPERLAELFRESAARLVGELRAAAASGDQGTLLRSAHTLKSISAHVSADELMAACLALENALHDNEPASKTEPLIAAVLASYAALDSALLANQDVGQPSVPAAQTAGTLHVLVVDDEENERFLVCHILERNGYAVDAVASGEAALEFCARNWPGKPNAIVLDGMMPGMDGIRTCKALRDKYPEQALKIVMLSGISDPAWRARAIEAGASELMEKSVSTGNLADNLNASLRGAKPA